MEKSTKKTILIISFAILLFVLASNFSAVISALLYIVSIFSPVIIGLLLAFVINVPMKSFEKLYKKLFAKTKVRQKEKIITVFSLVSTLLVLSVLVYIAINSAIPALISSAKSIVLLVNEKLPDFAQQFSLYGIDSSVVYDIAEMFDLQKVTSNAGSLLDTTLNFLSSTVSVASNTLFGIVIAVYVLLSKNTLAKETKKLMRAFMSEKIYSKTMNIAVLINSTYTKFFSSQCVEALILGSVMAMAFRIFKLPYALLIGFLTGLFSFVPYVGPFAACILGAFLALLISPVKAITSIIVFLVVQFVENQFIYPNVVGTSVGLSPLLTLIAALVGGNLFGIIGIVFFIPLTAVLCSIIKNIRDEKLKKKGKKYD